MRRVEIALCVVIAALLVSLVVYPSITGSRQEQAAIEEVRIGETDVSAELAKKLEIFTGEDYTYTINFRNSGERDLRYLVGMALKGADEITVRAWRESFVIKAGDDYEYAFILEGLKPGKYELDLTITADFFSSTELIEDVLRLGILGFLPKVEGIVPLLPSFLPFIVEMVFYLLSDLWAPIVERGFLTGGELDVIIKEVANALAREWDTIALGITQLLGKVIVDFPEILLEWMRLVPEITSAFEGILLEAPVYMMDHLGSLLLEGYLPMIQHLPTLIDGLLSSASMLRYFGLFATAALWELVPETISQSEALTLSEFLTLVVGWLALGGFAWFALSFLGLLTPVYRLYQPLEPLLKELSDGISRVLSPMVELIAGIISRISESTLGSLYGLCAPLIIKPLFGVATSLAEYGCVGSSNLLEGSCSPLIDVWETLTGSLLSAETPEIVSDLFAATNPIFNMTSDALWHLGSRLMPEEFGALKGEIHIPVEVEVRNKTPFEKVADALRDIWDVISKTI